MPKFTVRFLVARQSSWTNKLYAQLWRCSVGSPTSSDDLNGKPAKKSSSGLERGVPSGGGPGLRTLPRNVMLPRAFPYAALVTLLRCNSPPNLIEWLPAVRETWSMNCTMESGPWNLGHLKPPRPGKKYPPNPMRGSPPVFGGNFFPGLGGFK